MGRFGVVRTFVASVLLFTLASFLCGIAWSLSSLIAFRILQGAVSGPMIPGSQALLISIFPESKRTTALGVWSMRSEEHTSELQSLMRISYAVFGLQKKKQPYQ